MLGWWWKNREEREDTSAAKTKGDEEGQLC